MENDEIFYFNNVRNQYLATFIANLSILQYGCIVGWISPALAKLISDTTPLTTGPLTSEQVSWLGSINCLAAIFGAVCFAYIISLIGCKRTLLFLSVPCLIFWLFIYFGSTYLHIFLARFIGGWAAGGTQTTLILFVSEISNDEIRGGLGSASLFSRNVGTLIGFILGSTVDYQYIPFISASVTIVFSITFMLIPNTPRFYLREGKTQEAENALKYYKGYKGNSQLEDDAISKELERLNSIINEEKTQEKLRATDFCNGSAIKGIGIGISLVVISNLTAQYIITSYSVIIFQKAKSTVDPYLASIITAVALIPGSFLTTYLADILGRKILILISLIGSAFGLFSLALYHYLNTNYFDLALFGWVPVFSLCFVIFLSSVGVTSLALVCSVEYLPSKIRNIGISIIACSSNFDSFIMLKLFPILMDLIDLHGCMLIFGISCVVGVIFVSLVLKETKGQSLDDVGRNEKVETT